MRIGDEDRGAAIGSWELPIVASIVKQPRRAAAALSIVGDKSDAELDVLGAACLR
jgi:hypothetical protein